MDFKEFIGKDIQIKFFHFNNRTRIFRGTLIDFNRHYLTLISSYSKRKLLINRPLNIRFSVEIIEEGKKYEEK